MKYTMETFIHAQNIQNYRRRLECEPKGTIADDADRKMTLTLLAEAKIKDKNSPAAG